MTQKKKKKKKTGLDIVRQMDKSLIKKIILDEFYEACTVDETKEERTERNKQRAIKQYTPFFEQMGIDMNNVTFKPFPDDLSELDH